MELSASIVLTKLFLAFSNELHITQAGITIVHPLFSPQAILWLLLDIIFLHKRYVIVVIIIVLVTTRVATSMFSYDPKVFRVRLVRLHLRLSSELHLWLSSFLTIGNFPSIRVRWPHVP